jgi:hypothetical protein
MNGMEWDSVLLIAVIIGATAFLATRRGWDKERRRDRSSLPTQPVVTLPPRGGKVIGRIAPARRAP